MKPILQAEATECGLASITMVCSTLRAPRGPQWFCASGFCVSLKGATLRDLIRLADELGFATRALRLEVESVKELATPAILHWDLKHFVVLKSAHASHVVIYDPARGRRKLSWAEFSKHFTGVALEMSPHGRLFRSSRHELVASSAISGAS